MSYYVKQLFFIFTVKSVLIQSYSGLHFSTFVLNTDQNNSEYWHFPGEFSFCRFLHPFHTILRSLERMLYADFQSISWLAVQTNRIALECTVLMGSCKKKQTELEKLSSTFPTIYSLFMFVSFLVLTIHMLFSKEGKPYIIKSMKPAHLIVEWIFANFLG